MKRVNLTLSADEALIEAGREYARRQGKSLNQVFREYLISVTKPRRGAAMERFIKLAQQMKVNSGGHRFTREDAYED